MKQNSIINIEENVKSDLNLIKTFHIALKEKSKKGVPTTQISVVSSRD